MYTWKKHALLSLAAIALAGCFGDRLPKISEDEVIKSIQGEFGPYYRATNKLYGGGVKDVLVDVSGVKIGPITEMQLFYGKVAEPCWPVKADVRITVVFNAHAPSESLRGGLNDSSPGEGFCFYKDEFKDWKFKTSRF
ncbi:exported hypothetical protein [Rhodospirillaceae bacterium LM-1]|nr:exported hypothetical protein [Rhodospirillaceae bacterium LM-1]